MEKEKWKDLIQVIIIFIVYLFYTTIFDQLFKLCGIETGIATMFIADLTFFIGIILVYKKNLEKKYHIFSKEYSWKKKIGIIAIGVLILFLVNILMGMITEIFLPNLSTGNDDNSHAIIELFNISYVYTLFKTLLFAPIAEELLFKEAVRDVVKNNILFVIVSSTLYTLMNFMYASAGSPSMILDIIGYFLFAVILSIIYLKNDDNIIIVMFIKFFYNIIPTILLFVSMMAG